MAGTIRRSYTLSQDEINELCELAAKKGIEAYNEARAKDEKRRQRETDKTEITRKKLKEYRAVKMKVKEKEFTDDEIPELRFNALEDLMGQVSSSDDRTERKIRSRLDKQLADAIELKNIDTAYKDYKEGCQNWGSEEDQRRCRVIYKMYMSDEIFSVEEIAEEENIAERTVYRDVNLGVAQLASYLFGF